MADTKPTFNIFGPVTKKEIRVGYISTDRGYIQLIDLCEANRYEKNNPGTTFIYENRDKVLYLDIDAVNALNVEDLVPSKTASDGSCDGLQLESPCDNKTVANFYGGGGVGVLGNPIIGTDGAVLAVDIIEGGFGYQYPPIVEVKNGCDIGDGSLFESVISDDGYTINTVKYYDECPGIESNLELCDETPVEKAGWGRMFNQEGVDIGPWDPTKYTDNILADPIDLEMDAYKKQLAEFKNPFWTSREPTGLTITSNDKVTRLKYDVYHWAWGANPKVNPKGEIDNKYIKLFGRRGEPSGMEYWKGIQSTGKNLTQIESDMKTMPEWKQVCEGECKPVMPDVTYLGGQYYEYDKDNFMNKYAISPLPMSNVLGSDGKGDSYSMEWDVDFPYDGNYTFIVQCDNEGTLFVGGEKKSEYELGAGGASGATLSPPSKTIVKINKGTHPVRFDLVNLVNKKKVVKPDEFTAKTNDVDFKFSTSSYHGATASIEGLDMYIEKAFGPDNDITKEFTRKVEYGRVYDVTLTSNTFRSETRPSNNRDIIFEGLHPANNPINVSANRKRLNLRDGHGTDTNASFTIDSGNVKFSADGKRLEGNGEVTINLTWNDARRAGRAINRIKIGTTTWTRSGSSGSETHKITLGNITKQAGSDMTAGVQLRTNGERVLQMEDIPHVPIEDQKVLFDDVVLTTSQGRFFNIQGNKAKYTLDAPLPVDRSSSNESGDDLKVFDTLSFIDKSSRKLWKTNNLSPQARKDSANSFSNRYGITPFNPTVQHDTNYPGVHTIVWPNVKFPVTADYDITIAVDDNVRLKIGDQVNIKKDGFARRGDSRTATGTTVYRKRVKEGTYTLTAELEQIPGGKYGMNANSMLLAIDVRSIGSIASEVEKKSWNQNPFAVALAIESPPPPPPVREIPDVGEGCPENPIWSTMSAGASESWYPADHKPWSEFTNKYALSPVPPLDTPGTDGAGAVYSTSWKMSAPYAGNYLVKGTVEDTGKLFVNGKEIFGLASPTEVCSKISSTKIYLEEGTHDIEVQVENKKDYETPKFFIDQKVFDTQDWQNQISRPSGRTKDLDFKFNTATWHGATASIEALGMYIEKPFGPNNDVSKNFNRTVEYGRVYDVVLTSNTFRSTNIPTGNKQIIFEGLNTANNPINVTSNGKRLALKDGDGTDTNASFTIESGNAKFSADGNIIDGTGEATVTLTWNDRPRTAGVAVRRITIGKTTWTQSGRSGNETHTISLGGGTANIGEDMTAGVKLRTKGDNVLQMEDIPHVPIEDQKVLFDDVVLTSSEGKFFDINGNKAKFVLPEPINTGLDRGGVTYKGPALFHYTFKSWGSFMNKSSVSPDYPKFGGGELVTYEWSNVDFPKDGEYAIKFQMDHSATLYLDGQKIKTNSFIGKEGTHSQDMVGDGTAQLVKVNKGKHTLSVRPTVYTEASGGPIGFIDALFRKPSQDYHRGTAAFDSNPSGFAIGITIKTETNPAIGSKEELLQRGKSWKENPTAISAIMIPPPCPKKIKGKGVVVDVIVDDPGGPYPTPEEPPEVSYPVTLKLKKVIPDGGINYDPGDNPTVFPPYDPDVISSPNDGTGDQIIVEPPNGARLTPVFGPHGVPIAVNIENPGLGFTQYPTIRMPSDTGVGVVFKPQFEIVRDPLDVAPDKLLQVTDLVGLKQTGYVDGRAYYGTVFFDNDIKYAGLYETIGQKIRVYDTLQDSIDAMDRSEPSAIQRSGTDVSSNDPRLDIPNTPDNLI